MFSAEPFFDILDDMIAARAEQGHPNQRLMCACKHIREERRLVDASGSIAHLT